MKNKAVLFARVSTREQAEEGYSLAAQIRLLKEYAQKNEFVIVKQFIVPESASGKQERKIFKELLAYLQENTSVKAQLWEKVDRSARNFQDSVLLDDWLNEDEERQIHFVKQALIMHKNAKSHEKFMWDIYVATARQYSNNLSEETKKGLNEKAAQGHFPGNHKRGYKTVGDIGHKIWVVNNDKPDAKYIEMGFILYDSGNFTLRTLAKELFSQGWNVNGKPISVSELHKLLIDPFYCGEFIWRKILYKEAKHQPLVSKELFYRVQERMQRKVKAGKYRKHDFIYGNGLLICGECSRAVTAEIQKGHVYYHCTNHGGNCSQRKYQKEGELQNQVLELLDGFKVDKPETLQWIKEALAEGHQDETEYHSTIMTDLENRRKQAEKRLDILYKDRLDERITKDFYERNQKIYEEELEAVTGAISKHTKANINYKKLGINIFELSQLGREIYEKKALMNEKRELLNFVFSNIKLSDGKLDPTPHNGFEVIWARAKTGDWLRGLDSNQDNILQRDAYYRYTTPQVPLLYPIEAVRSSLPPQQEALLA